jgi:hypothetical protein
MELTVISHFYNEEFLLPYWLAHHTKIFDHGILVNYSSTDNSIEIIRDLAPHWEIRNSRNLIWDFIEADNELMEIEREVKGWKIILNTTEFILHLDLKNYLLDFIELYPTLLGVRTNGIVLVDELKDRNAPLSKEHLILQKHFGYLESDYSPITQYNPLHRSRFLHYASDGNYTLGRHQTMHSSFIEPNLFLLWFGYSPFEYIKARKLSFKNRMSPRNLNMGAGLQHVWDEEQLENAFLRESLRSYDLISKIPEYKIIIEQLKDDKNYWNTACSRKG